MMTSQMLEGAVLTANGFCVDGMGHITANGICAKCQTHVCEGRIWCKH